MECLYGHPLFLSVSVPLQTLCHAVVQGLEDQVVPPNQAQIMFDALKDRGITTALVMFDGEQHGFRQAENIRRALDGELYFYSKALNFKATMPNGLEPPKVVNLS
jgi:dienelactone hydrolase